MSQPDLTTILPFIHKLAHRHARARNRIPRASLVDAEDVAHDYFAHLLRKIHRYNAERGTLTNWAGRCITNLHQDNLRSEIEVEKSRVSRVVGEGGREGKSVLAGLASRRFDPVAAAVRREHKAIVGEAIASFQSEDAALLRKVFIEEKKAKHASKELNRSKDWGRCRVFHLLPRLSDKVLSMMSRGGL